VFLFWVNCAISAWLLGRFKLQRILWLLKICSNNLVLPLKSSPLTPFFCSNLRLVMFPQNNFIIRNLTNLSGQHGQNYKCLSLLSYNIFQYYNVFQYCSDTNFVSFSDEKCKTWPFDIFAIRKSIKQWGELGGKRAMTSMLFLSAHWNS